MLKTGTVKIFVGMDRQEAARLLRSAGAKATQIDARMPRGDDGGAVYEVPTGGLLMVKFHRDLDKTPSRISGLKFCQDPELPKVKRVWTDLTQMMV